MPELPKLAAPARRALVNAGIGTLADLTKHTESEVLALHGLGANALNTLRAAIHANTLNFKGETS